MSTERPAQEVLRIRVELSTQSVHWCSSKLRKAREKEGVQSRVEGEEERREKAGLGELGLGHRVGYRQRRHWAVLTTLPSTQCSCSMQPTPLSPSMYGIATSFLVVNIHTLYCFCSRYTVYLNYSWRVNSEVLRKYWHCREVDAKLGSG